MCLLRQQDAIGEGTINILVHGTVSINMMLFKFASVVDVIDERLGRDGENA